MYVFYIQLQILESNENEPGQGQGYGIVVKIPRRKSIYVNMNRKTCNAYGIVFVRIDGIVSFGLDRMNEKKTTWSL